MSIEEYTTRAIERLSSAGRTCRLATGAALLSIGLIPLAACDGDAPPLPEAAHTEGDGHDHGGEAEAGHAEGDGHDHGGEGEHTDEVTLTAEAVERTGITIETAQLWEIRPTFVAPARIAFNTEAMAHVGSVLQGWVAEINARLGDDVQVGDVLMVIESPELGQAQSELLVKRTDLETSGPAVDLAEAAWRRAQQLYDETQGISLTEVQRREAEYKAALAAQKSAQSAVSAAENRLHILGMGEEAVQQLLESGEVNPKFQVRAPIAGEVVAREVTLGELVSPERDALIVIADTSTVWVIAEVPEAHLGDVAVGAQAWVSVGGVRGAKFEGAVSYISPMVDPDTRTTEVRIEVPGDHAVLKPGAFAQVEIVASGEPAPPTVAVPEAAIQTLEGEPVVFVPVAGEPNTFAKRIVQAGDPVGGLVPIYAGLVEGESFVASSTFVLKADLGKSSAKHVH